MNGVHDMGGTHGHGRGRVERDEPVFHAAWEGRVYGMTRRLLQAGVFNLDEFRHLAAPKPALVELGITQHQAEELVVVENTPSVHNVIVCTLCSCYPWMVLGLPPTWYKSAPYRSRVVLEPRIVLSEMGLELPSDAEVRVWDSSADVRYMVLPERPAGTEDWSEERLGSIVTRDCMIGVARPSVPAGVA